MLVANEGNIKGTARRLQIPEKTLAGWRDEEPRLLAQDFDKLERIVRIMFEDKVFPFD